MPSSAAAASAPQEGVPEFGPDGRIYPGTCRGRPMSDRKPGEALRYDFSRTVGKSGEIPVLKEMGTEQAGEHEVTAEHLLTRVGAPVLARSGMAASYHFAVVLDDAATGVTDVIRGAALFEAAFLQSFLKRELGLPSVRFYHHQLIRDEAG